MDRTTLNSLAPISMALALERAAATTPARIAVICETESYSYDDLNAEVNRLTNAWLNFGAVPGEVVCSFLPKGIEFAVCFLATQKAGLVFASLNANAPNQLLVSQLQTLPGRFFVLPSTLKEGQLVRTITAARPGARIITAETRKLNDREIIRWDGILIDGSISNPPFASIDSVCYLNFTSGTTGVPKAAVGTGANIFWNTVAAIEALGLASDDIHLSTFPSFLHPHEQLARSIYLSGATTLIEAKVKPVWDMLLRNGVTCLMSSPSFYRLLVDYGRSVGESPTRLRIAESGGSILPSSLAEQTNERLRARVIPVWGSTETMGIAIAASDGALPLSELMLGSVCPTYEAQVVDQSTFLPVADGQPGELRIRGPGVASGYFTPIANAVNPFRDGWYYTGDIVKIDKDRNLHLSGRRGDMIKSRGLKVFPAEVELVLRQHPSVRDVAVVGLVDNRAGEIVAAIVVLAGTETPSVRELLGLCKAKLDAHKGPRKVRYVSEIPRDDNGKIVRSRVSELLSQVVNE